MKILLIGNPKSGKTTWMTKMQYYFDSSEMTVAKPETESYSFCFLETFNNQVIKFTVEIWDSNKNINDYDALFFLKNKEKIDSVLINTIIEKLEKYIPILFISWNKDVDADADADEIFIEDVRCQTMKMSVAKPFEEM
jgi:GTPase SAR1 family protein